MPCWGSHNNNNRLIPSLSAMELVLIFKGDKNVSIYNSQH